MEINGRGLIILNAGSTQNFFSYQNNKELKEMIERFYKKQGIKGIIIVDCQEKNVRFVDDDEDYQIIDNLDC